MSIAERPSTTAVAFDDHPVKRPGIHRQGTRRSGRELVGIDALRASAAGLVVLTHVGFNSGAGLSGPWAGWLARGDAGVAVFFVLSGFLLIRSFLGPEPVTISSYLWHRALRLIPAYLLLLIGVWVLIPSSRLADAPTWLAAWTLTSTAFGEPFLPGLSHTWSLGTEVAFYLALPLIALAALGRPGAKATARRATVVFTALIILAVLWRAALLTRADTPQTMAFWLPGFLDWFTAGMILAWFRERDLGPPTWLRDSARASGAWWAIALVFYWAATTTLAGPFDLSVPTSAQLLTKHALYTGFAVALVLPVVFAPPNATITAVLSWRPLVWIGTVSYGLFLWHMVLLTALIERTEIEPLAGPFPLMLAFTIVAGLIMGAVSWYAVERPIQRRWRNRVR